LFQQLSGFKQPQLLLKLPTNHAPPVAGEEGFV